MLESPCHAIAATPACQAPFQGKYTTSRTDRTMKNARRTMARLAFLDLQRHDLVAAPNGLQRADYKE
jgi:hypothetical protein